MLLSQGGFLHSRQTIGAFICISKAGSMDQDFTEQELKGDAMNTNETEEEMMTIMLK
jgi:hypothetical protein